MGISLGVAQGGVQSLYPKIGDRMFQDFCLGVNLVPRVAEGANQEGLYEPMTSGHRHGDPRRKLADRLRDGGSRYAESVGEELYRHRVTRPLARIPDALEIVLGCSRNSGSIHERQPKW